MSAAQAIIAFRPRGAEHVDGFDNGFDRAPEALPCSPGASNI